VFDGVGRTLTSAFIANNKHHLRFDGFYFVGFNNATHDSPLNQPGVFLLSHCSDIDLTRCFMDGRGPGYSPVFLNAFTCADLLVKNCVIMSGFTGLHTISCPGLRLEHNVFLRNLITAVIPVNQPHQKVYFRKNIFTDGIPVKVGAPVMEVGSVESLVEENNCYYLRVPDTEKKMFMFYGGESYWRCVRAYDWATNFAVPPVFTDLTRLNLREYQAQFGDTGSFVADPLFKGALTIKTVGRDGRPLFMADSLAINKKDLDFPDLFATHPEVVKKGIGLVPEDFKDFHFNAATNRIQSAQNKGAL